MAVYYMDFNIRNFVHTRYFIPVEILFYGFTVGAMPGVLEEEQGGGDDNLGLVAEETFFVDVLDRDISFLEGFADEFRAVAVFRFAFAAHQGDADAFFVGGDNSFEAFEEEGLGTDEFIIQFANAVITGGVGGAATEGIAHVDVAKAGGAQGGDEFGLAVLGVEGGIGDGTDIDEEFNGILFQQLEEGGERTGAVADGEKHGIKLRNLVIVG